MNKMTRRALAAAGLALTFTRFGRGRATAGAAAAAAAPTVRIRGTIEKVDGNMMTIKTREGSDVSVKLADNARVQGLAKASLADIKTNSYIGVTAMPQAGRIAARGRHPHLHRGAARHRRRPPAVGPAARQHDDQCGGRDHGGRGRWPGGHASNTRTARRRSWFRRMRRSSPSPPADKAEIKPGAKIIIMGAQRQPDGSLQAPAIYVGQGRRDAADVSRVRAMLVRAATAVTARMRFRRKRDGADRDRCGGCRMSAGVGRLRRSSRACACAERSSAWTDRRSSSRRATARSASI